MRRYTEKPCPGCGAVAERRAGSLCLECRQFIEAGRERVREIEAMKATGEKVLIAVDRGFVFWPKHTAGPSSYFLRLDHDNLLEALVSLGQLQDPGKLSGGIEGSVKIYFKGERYHAHPKILAWATPTQAEAIKLILDYARQMFEWYFFTGHDLGKNLLHRLAVAGTRELNELVIERSQ